MNFPEIFIKEFTRAAKMRLSALEEALADTEHKKVGELIALSVARKAADGNMDAIKFLRDLSKTDSVREEAAPSVAIRVVREDDG